LKDNQDSFQYIYLLIFESNESAASYQGEPDRMTDELSERVTKYTDACNANPNDYDTCMNLVLLYMQIGSEAEKVIEFSTKALDIKKGDPLALYVRGLAYYKMGDHNQNTLNDLQAA
jgi:tetratricopeptide (TPR) repeat protein